MEKFNEYVMVAVSAFQKEGSLTDTNGKTNVWLTAVAGKIPNQSMVIAGTVAEKALLTIGGTFLVNVVEGEEDAEYGRQFNVVNLGAVPFTELISVAKQLGKGTVVITKAGAEDTDPEDNAGAFQGKLKKADEQEELSDEEILAAAKADKLKAKKAADALAKAEKK